MKLTLIKEAVEVDSLKEEEVTEPVVDEVETPVEELPVKEVPTEEVSEIEEPVTEEPKSEKSNLILTVINDEINNYWQVRERFLMLAENVDELDDSVNKKAIKNLLNEVADDVTINIGMLYKIVQLINPQLALLLDKGQNKASEALINEE